MFYYIVCNGICLGFLCYYSMNFKTLSSSSEIFINIMCSEIVNKAKLLHSSGFPNNPYPELNQIPRTDTYFFKIYSNVVFPSMPRVS